MKRPLFQISEDGEQRQYIGEFGITSIPKWRGSLFSNGEFLGSTSSQDFGPFAFHAYECLSSFAKLGLSSNQPAAELPSGGMPLEVESRCILS